MGTAGLGGTVNSGVGGSVRGTGVGGVGVGACVKGMGVGGDCVGACVIGMGVGNDVVPEEVGFCVKMESWSVLVGSIVGGTVFLV